MPAVDLKQELFVLTDVNISLYVALLSLLEEERSVLSTNAKTLEAVTEKKIKLLDEIVLHKKKLYLLITDISHECGIAIREVSFSRLAALWHEPKLLHYQKEIATLLEKIKARQLENNKLIHQGLSMMNDILAVLYSESEGPLYGAQGSTTETKQVNKYLDGHL